MLADLISKYQAAQQAWHKQFDEDEKLSENSPEWQAYMDLMCAIIDYPCHTMEDVSDRARFILTDHNLKDTLMNCSTDAAIVDFLKSMIPEVVPVDIGEK